MKGGAWALGALLVWAAACPRAATALERLPAVLHVHSNLSTGDFSLDELAGMAEKQGVGALLLTDNYLLRIEYGLPPFRALTRVVHEERGILDSGPEAYLRRIAEAQARHPRVLLIPGVEVLPHYYWSGSPLHLDMMLHNVQKNLLVFGVTDPAALASLPVTGNARVARYTWQSLLDTVPLLLLIPGLRLLAAKRSVAQRVGRAFVIVRRRRWLAGGLLCVVGVVAALRAWPFASAPYPPYDDLGLAPHQRLIDDVNRLGGATVWSFPEARDTGERWVGPIRVEWRTDPYPDDLLRTSRYTAFGAVYEDTTRFEQPGEGWDRLLQQYARGERSRPAWAVGESGFHGFTAGKSVGPVQTVFLVTETSEAGALDALKRGRMYALQRPPDVGLDLAEFAVGEGSASALSGETLRADRGAAIEVRVGIDATGAGTLPLRVKLVRNGAIVGLWAASAPFRTVYRETFDGAPAVFRVDVAGRVRLLTNPIFVMPRR